MAGRPPAKLELVDTNTKNKEGKNVKKKFGTIWRSDFEGTYNVTLALPHPTEKNSSGYPVDDDVVAIKCRSGAKYKVDRKQGFFINLNAYEDMGAKAPYDGDRKAPAASSEETNEDFGDDDF
jgi:hypothetical protein